MVTDSKKFDNSSDLNIMREGYRAFVTVKDDQTHFVWVSTDTLLALIEVVNTAWTKNDKKLLQAALHAFALEQKRLKFASLQTESEKTVSQAFQITAWKKVEPVLKGLPGVKELLLTINGTNSNGKFDRIAHKKALDVMFTRLVVLIIEDGGIKVNIPVLRKAWKE